MFSCCRGGASRRSIVIFMIVFGLIAATAAKGEADGSGISDGAVRIGVLGDYGSGRDLGGPGSVTAARLAAEDFHNKVLGKPIEIVAADHQNKPDIAVGLAR